MLKLRSIMEGGKYLLLTGVFLIISSNQPVQAQDEDAKREDQRLTFEVTDRKIGEVVDYIRQQTGANIVVDEGIEAVVTLKLNMVPWRKALDLAAERAGCVVVNIGEGVLKVERPPRVRFAFENADITKVIDSIAKVSGANIIVGPEVQGTVSVRLNDVPFRDALDNVVKSLGYVVVEENRGILRVTDPLTLKAQLESRAFQLRYVRPPGPYTPIIENDFVNSAEEDGGKGGDIREKFRFLEALEKALSPNGRLDYIDRQNVIIVSDIRPVLDRIGTMIQEIDTEPRQVFVDVKFISTANTDVFNLGIDYGGAGPQASMNLSKIPIELPFHMGGGGFEDNWIVHNGDVAGPFPEGGKFTRGTSPGAVNIPDVQFGALDFNQVAGTLRLLESDTDSEVVQAPKIIALDHQPSTIFVGERVPYAEVKTQEGQAGGLQLSVQEAAKSPVSTGFQLLIIPHVIPGSGKIMMDIIPSQNALTGSSAQTSTSPAGFDVFTLGASGFEGTIALPRISSSTIATSLMLEDGHTAVIGGLSTYTQSRTFRGIPLLMDIPVLGWLFKNESTTDDRRNTMVLITPTVLRSTEDNDALLEKELENRRNRFESRLEEIFDPTIATRQVVEEVEAPMEEEVKPAAEPEEGEGGQ